MATGTDNLSNSAPVRVTDSTETNQLDITAAGEARVIGQVNISTTKKSALVPDPSSYEISSSLLLSDENGSLQARAQVLTDEGNFRDDFVGTTLATALTGTFTFTNNSTAITGVGTLFTTELAVGQYIKKTADSETLYLAVSKIISNTSLTLVAVYAGTTASTTAVESAWVTSTGTGSIAVSTSILTLNSGTTNGSSTVVYRHGDFLPYHFYCKTNISQRIANQTAVMGLQSDVTATPEKQATFVFDGATNTTVKCRSSFGTAAADTQETSVTLPAAAITSANNTYQIDLTANKVTFSINDIVVAVHKDHMPGPYDQMIIVNSIRNAAVVTTTALNIDYFYFANLNEIQISNDFTGEPIKVQVMGKSATTGFPTDLNLDSSGNLIVTALTGFGADFCFGDVSTAATTQFAIRRTTYTEQAVNAQRSIVSSSANDTAAGTGARTVLITYYTSAGVGPLTETLTLNGITAVNTVSTTICFIENILVVTVGATGSNVGILTLKAAVAGGGATIGTIAATDNQTIWAHHYVPTGKVANITGISASHNGTVVGSGGVFVLKAQVIGLANAVELQVSDFVRLYGQSSSFSRVYQSPIKVTGPARLTMYVTPESAAALIYRSSFDFFEPN